MKKSKLFISCFVMPCVIVILATYFYPVIRTIIMSFFQADSVTASLSSWKGLINFERIANSVDFRQGLVNMLVIWIVGGVIAIGLALLFAVLLSGKNIRFKHFFRAMIYLPNVISAVALGNAWLYYVYNYDFGLLNQILGFFGMDPVKWLGSDMKFWAMLFAIVFGCVGYYMMVFIGGIERIPEDIMEAATLDGAGPFKRFTKITLPLLKGTTRTVMTFWTIVAVQSFVWTKVFSPDTAESSTIVPLSYMYEILFGSLQSPEVDAGTGAAVGVLVAVIIMIITSIINRLFKTDDLEM